MTIFGVIWILLLVWACLKKNGIYETLTFVLFGMVLQSDNVIVLGPETAIGAQFFSNGAFVIKSLFIKSKSIDKNVRIFLVLLFLLLLYITINSAFVSPEGLNFIQVSMLWLYYLAAYRLAKTAYIFSLEYVIRIYKILVVFILVVGALILAEMVGIFPRTGILEALFYNDTISGTCYYQDEQEHTRFSSTFLEPSYCAAFLVGALYFFLITGGSNKKTLKLIVPIVIAILLSKSSTAFGALAIVFIIYLFSKSNKKILKYLIPIGFLTILLLSTHIELILNEVIFSKFTTGSAMVRENWNMEAMLAFYKSPIFGCGYSTQRASSIFCTILGELGLVGMFFYMLQILAVFSYVIFKKSMTQYYYGACFMIIAAIVCQLIACPDISFCVYWLSVYLFILLGSYTKFNSK